MLLHLGNEVSQCTKWSIFKGDLDFTVFIFFLYQFFIYFDKATKIISSYEVTLKFNHYSNSVAILSLDKVIAKWSEVSHFLF